MAVQLSLLSPELNDAVSYGFGTRKLQLGGILFGAVGMLLIGFCINVGMYIERMLILLPPLAHPRLTYNWSDYFPSWVELTIMAGSMALAVLLYVLAVKFVPIISIWEEKEGRIHEGTAG